MYNSKMKGSISKYVGLLILMLLTLTGNLAFAKKEVGVSGQVKDAKTKDAIEFCSVRIFNM